MQSRIEERLQNCCVQFLVYHKPPFLVLVDPSRNVEVWATDEHRFGLKPILCRVWAPKGQWPIAIGHHRYKWLYVAAFVQPISGETVREHVTQNADCVGSGFAEEARKIHCGEIEHR